MTVMKPLLAIDTSVPVARVAVFDMDAPHGGEGDAALLAAGEQAATRHSSSLLPLCDRVLRAAQVPAASLAAIACGSGPGSFTGLRVGLSVAKGLCLGTGAPLLLVSSLEALAHDLWREAGERAVSAGAACVPCLDAGKDQVYAALFRPEAAGLARASEDWALAADDLCDRLRDQALVIVGGTGAERAGACFDEKLGRRGVRLAVAGPTALSVGRLALAQWRRGLPAADLETSVPAYGRAPDITTPKKKPPPPPRRNPPR